MLLGTAGKPINVSATVADGRTDLFCRARILDSAGALSTTLSLPHTQFGCYAVNYTPPVEGYFNVLYDFFFDVGLTIEAGYGVNAETLDVNSFRTDIMRLLGLAHANSLLDQTSHDSDGNLLSGRLRIYDTQANVAAATAVSPSTYNTGLLFQYSLYGTYVAGLLQKWHIEKVL